MAEVPPSSSSASLFPKKSAKKKFKSFNANTIDPSTVTASRHIDDTSTKKVDAPNANLSKAGVDDDGWTNSDVKVVKKVIASNVKSVTNLKFNTSSSVGTFYDESEKIQERLRIEETRGMLERVRMKAAGVDVDANGKVIEKEKESGSDVRDGESSDVKVVKKDSVIPPSSTTTAASTAAAATTTEPAKWISPSARRAQETPSSSSSLSSLSSLSNSGASGGGGLSGIRFGTRTAGSVGGFRKVDTSDTYAFPTLGGSGGEKEKDKTTGSPGAWGK